MIALKTVYWRWIESRMEYPLRILSNTFQNWLTWNEQGKERQIKLLSIWNGVIWIYYFFSLKIEQLHDGVIEDEMNNFFFMIYLREC